MENTLSPFAEWLDAERGRVSELALHFGIEPSAVTNWRNRRVPAERIPALERMTGLSPAELRPDLYADTLPAPRSVTPATMDAARHEEALTSAMPECAP